MSKSPPFAFSSVAPVPAFSMTNSVPVFALKVSASSGIMPASTGPMVLESFIVPAKGRAYEKSGESYCKLFHKKYTVRNFIFF